MVEKLPRTNNTRVLLKSMAVIGSAQFLSIALRILKVKVVAVLLGPSGAGLLSVFANLQMLGSQAAGLGLPQSGVRDLATAHGNNAVMARVKYVLLVALALQGGLGLVVIWILRSQLSLWLLDSTQYAAEIGLVGVAVLLFLVASSQQTLLRGMRRIADLGRVMIWGSLAGAVVGITTVYLMGNEGLIWVIVAEPLGALLVGTVYIRRLPLPTHGKPSISDFWQRWRPMVRLGLAFMLGGLLTTATLLIVRAVITRDLGLAAAGQFAAAWTITITYVGFLLQAMGADYFPSLSKVINNREAVIELVNDQLQLVLALGGPIILLMIGLAPWVIEILYSTEFDDAASLLQWQMVGNVFKLVAWSIGLSFVAAGWSGPFLYLQVQFNFLFFGLIWASLANFGIDAAGVGFLLAYMMQTAVVVILARRWHRFRWEKITFRLFILHVLAALALFLIASISPLTGAIFGACLSIGTAIIGGHGVIAKLEPHGSHISHLVRFYKLIGWPINHK